MMSTVSFSKKANKTAGRKALRLPKIRELFDTRYFLIDLKQRWPLFMLFAIVMFFAIPVIILFGSVNKGSVNYSLERSFNSSMEAVAVLCALTAIAAGVFCAISITRDLMKPGAAGFVHSLPMRRECHLLVRLSSGFGVYFGALILNMLIGLLITMALGALPYAGRFLGRHEGHGRLLQRR